MQMQDEAFENVGPQDMNINGYQVSDLEDIEFHWEDPDFNMDAVFRSRSGIDTPFSYSISNDFEMVSMAENPILVGEKQDKENSPLPTTPVSERPNQSPVLTRNRPSRLINENVHDFVCRASFQKFMLSLLCM